MITALRTIFPCLAVKNGTGDDLIDTTIKAAGYAYDFGQDMFYSTIDAWQRGMGYCRLYDEAAAIFGMIIDCEPIYFNYNGRGWLIELWKGQYDLTTGCEIGVYTAEEPNFNIPGVFNGSFYHSVRDEDLLQMSCTLKKNDETLFTRQDKHWWLTGFKLGEFSEPWELIMDLSITLKDKSMRDAFIKGLKNVGYSENEITTSGNMVKMIFDKARTAQPTTRTPETDWIIQRKNKLLCYKYKQFTKGLESLPDKINTIKKRDPELYESVINIVKTKKFFSKYMINYID